MLKITAPIHAPDDCEALINAGARELYCGVMSGENDCLNFRPVKKANLPDFSSLGRLVGIASRRGTAVYFCVNAFHSGESFSLQLDQVEKALRCGVSGFIIADFSLIPGIRKLSAAAKIIMSTAAACANSEAVGFYARLGVNRVVLERLLTIDEITSIANAAAPQGIEVEIFVKNITCVNINGLCHLHHSLDTVVAGGRRLPPCRQDYELRFFENSAGGGGPVLKTDSKAVSGNRLYCGVCALYPLFTSSVAAVKIVGRDLPVSKVLKDTGFIARYMAELQTGRLNDGNFISRGISLYADYYGAPCAEGQCFYYETRRRRPGAAVNEPKAKTS